MLSYRYEHDQVVGPVWAHALLLTSLHASKQCISDNAELPLFFSRPQSIYSILRFNMRSSCTFVGHFWRTGNRCDHQPAALRAFKKGARTDLILENLLALGPGYYFKQVWTLVILQRLVCLLTSFSVETLRYV